MLKKIKDIQLLTKNQTGVLYMVASVMCFAIMDICIKWLNYYPFGEVFFKIHDPTQKDMQYPDMGTQYRSEIFYDNEQQKNTAENYKNLFNEKLNGKIETNISKIKNYCKAEEYHQKYIMKRNQ